MNTVRDAYSVQSRLMMACFAVTIFLLLDPWNEPVVLAIWASGIMFLLPLYIFCRWYHFDQPPPKHAHKIIKILGFWLFYPLFAVFSWNTKTQLKPFPKTEMEN